MEDWRIIDIATIAATLLRGKELTHATIQEAVVQARQIVCEVRNQLRHGNG